MRLKKESGFQLLEQVISLILVVYLSLGIYDLARIFQVKSALNFAVEASLRCLYPLEADCQKTSASNNAGKMYVANLQEKVEPAYSENFYDYSGVSSWINLPELEFSSPQAKILQSVNYNSVQKYYHLKKDITQRSGLYSYYLKVARSPYALTNGNPKNPSFVYMANHDRSYPLAKLTAANPIDISGVAGSTNSSKNIGSAKFTLPKLQDLPCYQSREADILGPLKDHTPAFLQNCDSAFEDIIIHVSGKVPLRNSSIGQVFLKISQDGIINRELGGLKFWQTAGQSGNLVPRGLPKEYYDSNHGYVEFYIHSPISVRRAKEITLSFRIAKFSGPSAEQIAWYGSQIKVFTSDYQLIKELKLNCNNTTGDCSATYPVTNQKVPEVALTSTVSAQVATYSELGCFADGLSPSQILQQANQTNCSNCQAVLLSSNTCPTKNLTAACNNNYGVSGNPNSESYEEAKKFCSPSFPYIGSLSWTESLVSLGSYKINRKTKSCADFGMVKIEEIPAALRPYKKLSWLNKKTIAYHHFYTGADSPSEYISKHQELNCPQITIGSQNIDWPLNNIAGVDSKILESSYFNGVHSERGMGCDWLARLWQQAVSAGVDGQSYFIGQRQAIKSESTTNPTNLCGQQVIQPEVALSRNIFGPASLEAVMQYCAPFGHSCSWEESSAEAVVNDVVDIDFNRAIYDYGFKALSAELPKAKFQCSEVNCSQFEVVDSGEKVKVKANYKLRFFALPFITHVLTAEGENYWEKAL